MKKILYIVEYFPFESNSVADILNNAIEYFKSDYSQAIVKEEGHSYCPRVEYEENGVRYYSAEDVGIRKVLSGLSANIKYMFNIYIYISYKLCSKLLPYRLRKTLVDRSNLKFIENTIKTEKPDVVVLFMFSPNKNLVDLCIKNKIPYCYALYDTYLERPNIDADYDTEKYVIDNSVKYFVPNFFCDAYHSRYRSSRVCSYELPLLIPKQTVEKAVKSNSEHYNFSYFGQLQTFRNIAEITSIFAELGQVLDVFSTYRLEESTAVRLHEPIKWDALYSAVAHSDFLVAFDNNYPYENYLPSKAYLYVSFSKPIIVFGKNKNSALGKFLSHYPCYYYHVIGDSLNGLRQFVDAYRGFHACEQQYTEYLQYLPSNSLERMKSAVIQEMKHKNDEKE